MPCTTPWDLLVDDAVITFVAGTCTRPRMLRWYRWRDVFLLNTNRTFAVSGRCRVGGTRGIRDGSTAETWTLYARRATFGGSGHAGMQGSEIAHHFVVELLFVSMDGLSMLTQIIETRKLFATVTREWTFSGMFSDVPG